MSMCILEIKDRDNLNRIMKPRPNEDDATEDEKETRRILRRFNFTFPAETMEGTRTVGNKRLVLIDIEGDIDEFIESVTTNENDEDGRPIKKNLQWDLLGRDGVIIKPQKLQPYLVGRPVFDEDGNQTGTQPIDDPATQLTRWFGKEWSE